MDLLELSDPRELKSLPAHELAGLAQQIRERILGTVSCTGGHLAPNLGAVELTLALHSVFESPRDRILWDVSHQSYTHKLLTGRAARFHTLRQHQGLAGFTDPAESEHDHFLWGHAGTSIGAAVGMAKARDVLGEHFHVVAVIGDGSLTCGQVYEALNQAGQDRTKVIVVINDNRMSISPNVGAISRLLARVRTAPGYHTVKKQVATRIKHTPLIGARAFAALDRWKESLKHLVLPTMFFEDLGWTYIGPVDGHDVNALKQAFLQARDLDEPVVVHAVTVKGQGVPYAEQRPDVYHGLGPFDRATGTLRSSATTYSDVFGQTLVKLAKADRRIVAITAAMSGGTGLNRFAAELPGRFYDVGIAEQNAVTFAAGLAKEGLRPVFAVYSTFLQRGYDQVLHDVCLQNLPVTFAIDRAGLVEDGATHQGLYDLAFLRSIPNLVLGSPTDENELKHMLHTGLRHNGPFALRYPRGSIQGVRPDEALRELAVGKGEILRAGSDVAIIALGTWTPVAVKAAAHLAEQGISACVINPRWVKPLDRDLLLWAARETGALLTVEEAALAGGFGTAILELLADEGLTGVRVKRLGLPDQFIPHGNPQLFHHEYGLSVEGIARAAGELVDQPVRQRSVSFVGRTSG